MAGGQRPPSTFTGHSPCAAPPLDEPTLASPGHTHHDHQQGGLVRRLQEQRDSQADDRQINVRSHNIDKDANAQNGNADRDTIIATLRDDLASKDEMIKNL